MRGIRAIIALVLATTGLVTYISAQGDHALLILFLALAAVGFTAATVSRANPWAWTLGVGMVIVGLMFITPLGGPWKPPFRDSTGALEP